MNCTINPFGEVDHQKVMLYTFATEDGLEVSITNYGATITAINLLRDGNSSLRLSYGYNSVSPYTDSRIYAGATVGRFANRIADGQFEIGGTHFELSKNEGNNQLHGGINGFDKKIWETELFEEINGVATLKLYLHSPNGDEGFPGNLDVWITFQITDDNQISINYQAQADAPTHINLTSHSYFNLSGFTHNILDHSLKIDADHYLPINPEQIPTGEIRPLEGTPFDFKRFKAIGADIDLVDGVYDHCFVLNNPSLAKPSVWVKYPHTDIALSLYTTQPGLQLYTPASVPIPNLAETSLPQSGNWAFCLEPQHFPNTPNTPHFPTTLIEPGMEYNHTTILHFSLGGE